MFFIFLAAGTILRCLMFLTQKSWWFDEWASIDVASQSLKDVIVLNIADTHPPLYFMLLHWAIRIFGANDWAFRLPSLLAGIGSIVAVYLCAKEFFNKKTAILSALFTAMSPFFIHLSFEIRNHGLPIFLCTLATFFLLKIIKEPFSRKWGYAYALTAASSVYVSHFAWFWFASTVFFHIAYWAVGLCREKRSFIFQGIALGFSLMAMLLFVHHFIIDKNNLSYDDFSMVSYISILKQLLIVYWHFIVGPEFFVYWNPVIVSLIKTSPMFWFCGAVFCTAFFLFVRSLFEFWKKNVAMAFFFTTVSVAPLLIVAWVDFTRLETRYFAFAAPFVLMLLAHQIICIKKKPVRIGIIVLLTLSSLYGDWEVIRMPTDPMHKENYLAMTQYVVENANERDAVQTSPMFAYYLKQLKLSTRATIVEDVKSLTYQEAQKYDHIWYIDGIPVWSDDFPIIRNRMKLLNFYPKGREITFGSERDFGVVNLFERIRR